MKRLLSMLAVTTTLVVVAMPAAAANQCKAIQFGDVNWPGVVGKTETTVWLLEQLGYETDVKTASLPIMFQGLAKGDLDVFMGFWVPTSREMASKYMRKGSIDRITTNLKGAKYTVGVNRAAAENGVTHFKDIAEHKKRFGGTIYGIEAGNDGNQIIQQMIEDDAYGLGGWELKPSSAGGMLAAVKRRVDNDKWAAWLAWKPHPMNRSVDIRYLKGGASYWGPNQGGAKVYTLARNGFAWKCPNVGQLLRNFTLTTEEQSLMQDYMANGELDPAKAGRKLIKEKPELLDRWLEQGGLYQGGPVKTVDGNEDARSVVKKALGL